MANRLVLIEVNRVLVRDTRDVSEYVSEAIRSKYGLQPSVNLDEYEGFTSQEMLADVLAKNGVDRKEIDSRLESCTEELGYSYYNVTGSEPITVVDGAKQLLEGLLEKGVLVGVATGDVEEQARNRLQRAGLSEYIKFGSYGNREREMRGILERAVKKAGEEHGMSGDMRTTFISSSPRFITAAKGLGLRTIGVAQGRYSKAQLEESGADLVVGSLRDKGRIVREVLG